MPQNFRRPWGRNSMYITGFSVSRYITEPRTPPGGNGSSKPGNEKRNFALRAFPPFRFMSRPSHAWTATRAYVYGSRVKQEYLYEAAMTVSPEALFGAQASSQMLALITAFLHHGGPSWGLLLTLASQLHKK